MKRNINALVEGLPRTKGFAPTADNHSQKTHLEWIEWRLQVAKIPVANIRATMGLEAGRFVLECECCIAEFKELAHNSGLKFKHCRPVAGTSRSCWVEVEADPNA